MLKRIQDYLNNFLNLRPLWYCRGGCVKNKISFQKLKNKLDMNTEEPIKESIIQAQMLTGGVE